MPGITWFALAGVVVGISAKVGINFFEGFDFSGAIVIVDVFVGVGPEVDLGMKSRAEVLDCFQLISEAHDSYAVLSADLVEDFGLAEEGIECGLGRMVGGPEGRGLEFAVFQPGEFSREVRLNGDAVNIREMAELGDRLLIVGMNGGLSPGSEEDANFAVVLFGDPSDEAVEFLGIVLQLGGGIAGLGKRAIRAGVIAARERSPVENIPATRRAHNFPFFSALRLRIARVRSGRRKRILLW